MPVETRIALDPKIMLGKPVIRGTRIPVELILRRLAEGATEAEIIESYLHLSSQAIRAAIGYAADAVAHDTVLVDSEP